MCACVCVRECVCVHLNECVFVLECVCTCGLCKCVCVLARCAWVCVFMCIHKGRARPVHGAFSEVPDQNACLCIRRYTAVCRLYIIPCVRLSMCLFTHLCLQACALVILLTHLFTLFFMIVPIVFVLCSCEDTHGNVETSLIIY